MQNIFAKHNLFITSKHIANYIRNYPLLKPCKTRTYSWVSKPIPKALILKLATNGSHSYVAMLASYFWRKKTAIKRLWVARLLILLQSSCF